LAKQAGQHDNEPLASLAHIGNNNTEALVVTE
jgi:hypothetical protein